MHMLPIFFTFLNKKETTRFNHVEESLAPLNLSALQSWKKTNQSAKAANICSLKASNDTQSALKAVNS